MKIAVEFYGHLRSFRLTANNIIENFLKPLGDVDVFIHTWDETDTSDVSWHNANGECRGGQVTEDDINFLNEKYTPQKLLIEPQLKFNTQQNPEYYMISGGIHRKFSVTANTFYTRYKSNQLRLEYEKETGAIYDYVIQARLDISFNKKFDFFNLYNVTDANGNKLPVIDEERKLFHSHENIPFGRHFLNDYVYGSGVDVLYFGKPEVITKTVSIYEDLNNINMQQRYYSNEYLLMWSAIRNNILPVSFNFFKDKDFFIIRADGKTSIKSYYDSLNKNKTSKKFLKTTKNKIKLFQYTIFFLLSQLPLLNIPLNKQKLYKKLEKYIIK